MDIWPRIASLDELPVSMCNGTVTSFMNFLKVFYLTLPHFRGTKTEALGDPPRVMQKARTKRIKISPSNILGL